MPDPIPAADLAACADEILAAVTDPPVEDCFDRNPTVPRNAWLSAKVLACDVKDRTPLSAGDPAFGCYKSTIRTRSGRYFDLLDPKPDQFTLADIAGALSKICRFGGNARTFYSVCDHSLNCYAVAVADQASPLVQKIALLHDAAEAFVGDVVKPLKVLLPEYARVEARIEAVIAEKYGLTTDSPRETEAAWGWVKGIDMAVLIAERRLLFSKDGVKWTGEDAVRVVSLQWGMSAEMSVAEAEFLRVAAGLGVPVD